MRFSVYLSEDNSILINDDFYGTFSNNVIEYNDGIINSFDLNKFILKRECSLYVLIFDFINYTCTYNYGDYKMCINLELIDKSFSDCNVFVKYKVIETGHIYEYKVSWNK